MRQLLTAAVLLGCSIALPGCTCSSGMCGHGGASAQPIGHAAQARYIDAINTNDVDQMMSVMTDDVMFMPPNAPRMDCYSFTCQISTHS